MCQAKSSLLPTKAFGHVSRTNQFHKLHAKTATGSGLCLCKRRGSTRRFTPEATRLTYVDRPSPRARANKEESTRYVWTLVYHSCVSVCTTITTMIELARAIVSLNRYRWIESALRRALSLSSQSGASEARALLVQGPGASVCTWLQLAFFAI